MNIWIIIFIVVLFLSAITIAIVLLSRSKKHTNICSPPCKDDERCVENTCLTGICGNDNDCASGECINPNTPTAFCTACKTDDDCERNQYCINGGEPNAKCDQCKTDADCQDNLSANYQIFTDTPNLIGGTDWNPQSLLSQQQAENICTASSDCRGFITDGDVTTFKLGKWPEQATVDITKKVNTVAVKNQANICHDNKCIACRVDADCKDILDRPYCHQNTCVACTNDGNVRCADITKSCESGVCFQYCANGLPASGTYLLKEINTGKYIGNAMNMVDTGIPITWKCSGYQSSTGTFWIDDKQLGYVETTTLCIDGGLTGFTFKGPGYKEMICTLLPKGNNVYEIYIVNACPSHHIAWFYYLFENQNSYVIASDTYNPGMYMFKGNFQFIPTNKN